VQKSVLRNGPLSQAVTVAALATFAALCLLPLIHTLALSLSSGARSGEVGIVPIELNAKAYQFVARNRQFWKAIRVSAERVALGLAVDLSVVILTAYPLSRGNSFRGQKGYLLFFTIAMLFNGGLIPTFMVVKYTGLMNHILALVIPEAVNVANIFLLANFFKTIPRELDEAAFVDGAGHWRTLWRIYVPLSLPALAVVTIFILVWHWNAWFDGLLYIGDSSAYPLQTYLHSLVIQQDSPLLFAKDDSDLYALISERTTKAAQVLIAALPMLVVYPFLQRYFVAGSVLGGVKE
jgi:putative aldouronate transport system permease protein